MTQHQRCWQGRRTRTKTRPWRPSPTARACVVSFSASPAVRSPFATLPRRPSRCALALLSFTFQRARACPVACPPVAQVAMYDLTSLGGGPADRADKLANVNAAMAAMEDDGIRCRGYKAAGTCLPSSTQRRSRFSSMLIRAWLMSTCLHIDVVEGKPAALAEVVWQLMLHYHCRWRPSAEELAALASPRCPPPRHHHSNPFESLSHIPCGVSWLPPATP